MAVEVDGTRKRRAAAFLDDPFEVMQAKRGRCSPSATADSVADLGINMEFDPVEAVQSVFPGADPQLLRGYLEASGNVLDAAIRSFRDYLASDSATTNVGASSSGVASDVPVMNTPANRIEWAELIVKEMSSASDPNHARNRVFRILEMFDKCAANYNTLDEAHKMREDRMDFWSILQICIMDYW
uniref:CUE domain-containing protein n=1 Tax=Triticum urartu TaxID=4572 RepID=A0A8R7Q3Y1_TRIUA